MTRTNRPIFTMSGHSCMFEADVLVSSKSIITFCRRTVCKILLSLIIGKRLSHFRQAKSTETLASLVNFVKSCVCLPSSVCLAIWPLQGSLRSTRGLLFNAICSSERSGRYQTNLYCHSSRQMLVSLLSAR